MSDWMVRAIKTFVQAFFGVLIPEVVIILNNITEYQDLGAVWAVALPFIASALAAAISAVWNILNEKLKEGG